VNRRNTLPTSILTLTLVLLSPFAVAQQQQAPGAVALEEEQEPVRRYSVELIVFEYLDRAGDNELFLPDMPAPGDGPEEPYAAEPSGDADIQGPGYGDQLPAAADLPDAETGDAEARDLYLEPLEEIPTLENAGFEILDPADYVLNDAYRRLERLDAYRPLMHGAWIQPALEHDESLPMQLRRIGDPPLRLNGTVTLYLSRFLHLVVDVALEEKSPLRPDALDERIPYYGDNRGNRRFGINPAFVTPSVFYRIQDDRIMRSGDLRYFDHPKFGVLAKVMRIEEPESDDAGN
jgi:hypothetical protein